MSERPTPPPAALPLWATAVVIPSLWTPEQALAVFELLDDLRETLWAVHGRQIQALLQQQQRSAASSVHDAEPGDDDRSF